MSRSLPQPEEIQPEGTPPGGTPARKTRPRETRVREIPPPNPRETRSGPRGRTRPGRDLTVPPWGFVVPALVVYAAVVLYPAVAGVAYAFTDWSGIGDASFVGLANFRALLDDRRTLDSVVNTLLLTVAVVVVQNVVGLLLALGVDAKIRAGRCCG